MTSPASSDTSTSGRDLALGLLVIALGLGLVGFAGWKTYRYFFPAAPTATVALNGEPTKL